MPTNTTQSRTIQDVIKFELDNQQSRDDITILAGENISMGEILGTVTAGTVPTTGTAGGGNTGNGTMSSVTGGKYVQVGTYTITCIQAATNTGVFSVKDPNGAALPSAGIGAYTSSEINFTIADGSTDFVTGDTFTIAVPAGSGKGVPISFTAVDGSAIASGIPIDDYDASATGDRTVAFTSGGTYQIIAGDTVAGAAATARVYFVDLSSGTWAGGDAAGTLYLDTQVGSFASENLNVGGNLNVATIGGNSTAIAASDLAGVAITRDAQYVDDYLTWPTGATATQKATAKTELAALGIIERDLT
jgi:hypothetical protein